MPNTENDPSAEDWKRAIDALPDLICTLDLEHKVRFMNLAMAKKLGVTQAEATGLTCYEAVHATTCPPDYCPNRQLLQDQQDHAIEIHEGRLGGDFLVTCTPLRDQSGQLVGSLHVARDITERKRTEEALRLFKESVENSSDAVGMSTPEGKHYYQNKVFDEWFGEIGENPPETLFVDHNVGHEVFRAIMTGGQWTGEVQMYARDRSILTILLRAYGSKDKTGRITVLVCFHTDITERKHAEAELQKSKLITDNIPVGLYLYHLEDLSDDRTLRMVYANPAVKALTGLGQEEVVGKTLDDNFPGLRSKGIPQRFAEVVRTQTAITFEDITYGDNRVFLASFSVKAFPMPVNMVGIAFENITKRQRAADTLRQRVDELAALNTFSRSINTSLSLMQTVSTALAGILKAIQPDLAFLFLREEDRLVLLDLLPEAGRKRLGEIPEHRVGECMCGLAVHERRAIYSRDISADSRCTWEECKKAGIRSFAALPLCSGAEEVIGVIGLASETERDFEQQGSYLETLTAQVSIAMANARLHEALMLELSERRHAEEALRQSQETFRDLFEKSADAILLIDQSRMFVECNQAALNLLKMSRSEFINRPPVMISPEFQPNGRRSDEAAQDMIDQAYAKGLHRFDWSCVNSEGGEFIVDVSLMPILINRQTMLHTTWRDITKRKQVEEALRLSETGLRQLFQESPLSTMLFEKDTGDLVDVNAAALNAYGCSTLEELRAYDFWCDPPYSLADALEWNQKASEEGPQQFQWLSRKKSGQFFWEDVFLRRLYIYGKQRIIAVSVDITERKRIEEERKKLQAQLNQAQKMESVGRLAGGVAHDFNNMLGIILGYTEMCLNETESSHPLFVHLQKIHKAAERSATLTGQLLAFARKQTVAPKVLDLNETVEGMLQMLRRLIGEDINLAWRPGSTLDPVCVDPSQLDQILANLCVNARDAIADTGKVTIETGKVSFDDEYCVNHAGFVPGEFVMLAVSDDGCGMDAETLSHLFEPFFTTKELGKGTGLGLATVYGIVKQNNGFVNVYSEPGHGTTFKIYLPQHAAKAPPRPEPKQALAAVTGGETILLVEDELDILKMITLMLEKMGYTVIGAGIPGEAIRLAREHLGRIDLLMTDVIMPEMNGRDLAVNLMSIYPEIRRLFMSGYTANVIAHHGVLDQGVHFLQKPFSMKDLATKIREALDRE
jgi:PAS domain S-box-containing protein